MACQKDQNFVAILGAGSHMAGRIAHNLKETGYKIITLVRRITDIDAISKISDAAEKVDRTDSVFVIEKTKGCCAIVNFINQLIPPCQNFQEQLANDLKPIMAGMKAALANGIMFIHTSVNFSIPTKGAGNVITNQLPAKPIGCNGSEDHWDAFEHEGGLAAVATLAEAKHREDWAVQDFLDANPESKTCALAKRLRFGIGL